MRYKAIDFSYSSFDATYDISGDEIHDGSEINFTGALAGILKKPPGRFIYGRDDIIISPKYSYNLRNLHYVQLGKTQFYNYVTRKDQLTSKEYGDRSVKQDLHFTMTRFFIKVVDETDPLFNIDLIYNCVDDYVIPSTEFHDLGTKMQLRNLIITHEQYNSLVANEDTDDFGRVLATAEPDGTPFRFGRL